MTHSLPADDGSDQPDRMTPRRIQNQWFDVPAGFRLTHLAHVGGAFLVGGVRDDRPEVHCLSNSRTWSRFHAIPPPSCFGDSWDGLDLGEVDPHIAADGNQLAVTRLEYQGGSWGIVVYPDLGSPHTEEIESTTDSDIGWGRPSVLRGDDLFVVDGVGGPDGRLLQYRRMYGLWQMSEVAIPGAVESGLEWGWAMDLSADGNRLALTVDRDGTGMIEIFERGKGGRFVDAYSIMLPKPVNLACFAGQKLVVAFASPLEDGSSVWLMDSESGELLSAATTPAPPERRGLTELVVCGEFAVVAGQGGVFAIELASGRCVAELEVPARADGRAPYVTLAASEHRVCVGTDFRVAIFDLP